MAEERKTNLPYLAPLARVIPLVYDQSISYYEFLNKLYEAVDEVIGKCDDIIAELPEIRANIKKLGDEIGSLNDLNTAHKNNLVSAINEVLQALDNESTTRTQQVDTLNTNLASTNDTVRKHSTEIQNMMIEYGSERDSSNALVANIQKNKELYVGPGTISEVQGDIPYLKESIDSLRNGTEQEISELTNKTTTLENAVNGIVAPYWAGSGISASVSYLEGASQTITINSTVGDLLNKSFLVLVNNSPASSSLNSTVTCAIQVGEHTTNMYLAKLNAIPTNQFVSPDIQFEFFGTNGSGMICHHEFGAGTSNAGIYDGYKKITSSDVLPSDNTSVVISITLPINDPVNETSPVVYVKKIK